MTGKRAPTRTWTLRERGAEIAAAFRAGATYARLAKRFHCGYGTLQFILLVTIPFPEYEALVRATKRRVGRTSPHRFRKGNAPRHPCPKGFHLSPATEFKAGCLRGAAARRWRPVGTVVIRTHRRQGKRGRRHVLRHRLIKWTDSATVRGGSRWMSLARHLWERGHGPLPPGRFVVHADGDSLHDEPGNLVVVDRREWLTMQKRILPGFEEKRLRNHARGAREDRRGVRARTNAVRAESAPRDVPAGFLPAHECAACGYTISASPLSVLALRSLAEGGSPRLSSCPKCGGMAWRTVSVLARRGEPVLEEAAA